MQKILFLLIIQVLLNGCLGSTYDTHDSFEMYIKATSLNTETLKKYHVVDDILKHQSTIQKDESFSCLFYYPEAQIFLKNELKKQEYQIILHNHNNQPYISLFYVRNGILIRANNPDDSPLWELALVAYKVDNLRIHIPSMIKCAGKYFNKNFKGIVTCKR